ncbi:hypothetical protein N7475_006913 [Penicillium sp. IBT 31633x]|nr:hypothetical protein N7475_006913 [Penicillium sp. IBT 31633x]
MEPPHPPGRAPPGETKNLILLQRQPQIDQANREDEPRDSTARDPGAILDPTDTPDAPAALSIKPRTSLESTFKAAAVPLLLLLHGADTLIFIDPSREMAQDALPLPASTAIHRIHSEKLLTTGSVYFKRLFNPQVQTRVRKRRGLDGKLPDGIQYVLDLTPPILDEDAIIFLTELSCPMSIRTWASKQYIWNLPASCVGGQDDLGSSGQFISPEAGTEADTKPSKSSCDQEDESSSGLQDPGSPESHTKIEQQNRLPVEYSASRHREGIEHILHVLEGLSPNLDTPCKLWTFFALAKIFDVTRVPAICDHIIPWFYELSNARFIELHPEVAYRVACGIESSSLCQDAFVGMVGDEALLYLIRTTHFEPTESVEKLVRSRISDVLDDAAMQRIEYASKSFGDYVVRRFLHLTGSEMPWLMQIVEVQKLTRHLQRHPGDQEFVLGFIKTLKEYIRYRIYRALVDARDTNRAFHVAPSLTRSQNPYRHWGVDKGFYLQRLVGKDFWSMLRSLGLWGNEIPRKELHSSIAEIGNGSLAFADEAAARIRHVSADEVLRMGHAFNQLAIMRAQDHQEEEALAARHADGHAMTKMTINTHQSQSVYKASSSSNNNPFLDAILTPTPNLSVTSVSSMPGISVDTFSEGSFELNVHFFLKQYAQEMLQLPSSATIRHELTDTLTCLTYNEFQYLPLWAGGNDDETGGVFADLSIPSMDTGGFSGPGPAVHTGSIASTNDSFSEIDPNDSWSTVHAASHNATHSHISDILSIESSDYAQISSDHENFDGAQSNFDIGSIDTDDETSLDLDLMTDDEEYDTQSNGTVTMRTGSPSTSFANTSEDIDMTGLGDEDNDTDFEIVDMRRTL